MADEDPSVSSTASDSPVSPKKETVRITLPPKPEDTPMIKRETVRINAPGVAPKKETTNLGAATPLPAVSTPMAPPPAATRPLVPPPAPPPRPPSAPGIPPLGARPAIPPPSAPKPGLPPSGAPKAATYAEAKPVTIKAAPKKETARIQVSPTQKLPPQATVRLSQPSATLSAGPAPAIRTAAPMAAVETVTGDDPIVTYLSWGAVLFALIAAGLSGWAWYS
jgi:hypothetical protein